MGRGWAAGLAALLMAATGQEGPVEVGVVSHVQVLSDKVEDVSSLEAWRRSFLREGMEEGEKALAVWRSVAAFQHQDAPPREFLQAEEVVQDPIKVFNVYGYGFCSMHSSAVEALAREAGLEARGRIINSHSVPEVKWDGAWRLLDASLINYFPGPDGKPAGVDEIIAGVRAWYEKNPRLKGDEARLKAFMKRGGWRQGPEILSRTAAYDENGWLPAATHGWYSTMQEYDGSHSGLFEYGYSMGYRVNIQLRPGERLTRRWSHRGLHVNMKEQGPPGVMDPAHLRYAVKLGDIAPGRVGNGTLEYDVPRSALRSSPVVIRMPSSYVYLGGSLTARVAGPARVSYSENNGLDWREIAKFAAAGEQTLDLGPHLLRRYDYRLRFEGQALEALRIVHDVQHSQRPLPALSAGANVVTFRAGPPEGTITVEGSTVRGKGLHYEAFHPQLSGIVEPNLLIKEGQGSVTFPVSTPGDMVRLRFGTHYRARDAKDGWNYQLSFDGGKTFKTVDRAPGPTAGHCKYVTFSEIPPSTREALVRFSGTSRNATMIFNFRIDADYREPQGGFRPVKVTYAWEEGGAPKSRIFTARKPEERFTVECGGAPLMKSIALELAE